MSGLTIHTDPAARELIFREADLAARWVLINQAEMLATQRNPAWLILFHAETYLAGRKEYERCRMQTPIPDLETDNSSE